MARPTRMKAPTLAMIPFGNHRVVLHCLSERARRVSLPEAQRIELAKTAETELRTGLELLGKDKKTIQELIALVDPPAA